MNLIGGILGVTLLGFVLAHIALLTALVSRHRGWTLLAIPFVPLAPYWGYRAGMPKRVGAWLFFATAYAVFTATASLVR